MMHYSLFKYHKRKPVYLFFFSVTLLRFTKKKNALLYAHSKWEQMAQTMPRWIPLKSHTDSYAYFYYYQQ
jgi:hypothetical protein